MRVYMSLFIKAANACERHRLLLHERDSLVGHGNVFVCVHL